MTDKEKTAAILDILPRTYPFDRYICVPEFRFGSGYGNTSEKRADLFCISAEKGQRLDVRIGSQAYTFNNRGM